MSPRTKARLYVEQVELPDLERRRDESADPLNQAFNTTRKQAAIAGSEIFSFVEGVTPARRQAVLNSTLFAQLAANRRVADFGQIERWYEAYFEVLSNIGWVIQDNTFARYDESSEDFSAHKAILSVAAVLLGPGTTALALVKTTLEALQSMNESDPWITVFREESHKAEMARFQVGLVSKDASEQFSVALMAFSLKAASTVHQILFFKSKSTEVVFRHKSAKITINTEVLDGVQDVIRVKLAGLTRKFVNEIDLGG